MTHEEVKAAFMEECPVAYCGITYQRISALIYRKNHTGRGLRVQAELKDRNNHSVVIVSPKREDTSKFILKTTLARSVKYSM